MKIQKSAEDYLEAMLMMREKHGYIRSVDIAEQLGVTKPSVSYATKRLRENGYITMDPGRLIWYARNGQLPFACRISGNRVLVSRKSLLETYGYAVPEKTSTDQLIAQILEELKAIRDELKERLA
jgi:DNA-binding MarR family transcriptional regulator